MRHIITGGSGFTGKVLIRQLLEQDAEIINFDIQPINDPNLSKKIKLIQGDIRSPADLAQLKLRPDDVVYHLAARQFANTVPRTGRDAWFNDVNVVGTHNIVHAMQAASTRLLVFFSTDMTYGKPKVCPIPPDYPQNPLGSYGRSKLQAECILRSAEGISATIFRPRLITGYGRLGILGKLFYLIHKGLPVPMIGDGKNRYQMVGVEDCARAAILAVTKGCPSGPFNLGSEHPPTTRELLDGIIRHAHSRSKLLAVPAAPLKVLLAILDKLGLTLLYPEQFEIADADILLDTTATRTELGWSPSHDDIQMMNMAYDSFLKIIS
ncbi:NAD-dependent epimerase/dehydratase family protein [Acetobacter fabarum]|jgi:dTDP-glucose 4,6-dehydratase|uniref:NAD-dependent epimerase/dehydratase family protein n=1 Tax=Acetobacter fabarum TaxID=483199 RepID=UPI001404C320|nr:NAD(P)-dependent oxidoreductase [Acetobacter fabarum]NHO43237.1 NAD-dependent epimerase/dehydratase family protein [Acetobacter fabarum]